MTRLLILSFTLFSFATGIGMCQPYVIPQTEGENGENPQTIRLLNLSTYDLSFASLTTLKGTTEVVGPYTVEQEGTVYAHNYFERDLDAPEFRNFTSEETNTLINKTRINNGVCYGISMLTIRYFQWFILPSLLDDDTLARVRGTEFGFWNKTPKKKRKLSQYAELMARAMNLPEWILQWPEGTQAERTAKVAPYRLRTYLASKEEMAVNLVQVLHGGNSETAVSEEKAKEQAMRMFDNQFGIFSLFFKVGDITDELVHGLFESDNKIVKLLFGPSAFEKITSYVQDPKKGLMEVELCGSRLNSIGDDGKVDFFSMYWGHSVVAYKITKHGVKNEKGQYFKAYKVHVYDSNDPFNVKDNAFWYFPDVEKWTPSEKYAAKYDHIVQGSPLLPEGSNFLYTFQFHGQTENFITRREENLNNLIGVLFEKVEVYDESEDDR